MAEEDEEEYGQGYYLQPCESGIRESKRYVESPVHTPDEEGTAAPRFDKGASEADWEDDTRCVFRVTFNKKGHSTVHISELLLPLSSGLSLVLIGLCGN